MSPSPSPVRKLAPVAPEARSGAPAFLPYGRQLIEDDDIAAVVEALRADLLTTGPLVTRFERALCDLTGAAEAVACSNGTAALYMAASALGLGPGSTVIVPAITFAATASAPHLLGAEIVFADVDPETGLLRACDLEAALARCPDASADAVFPVHYAGQSCDMEAISAVARARGLRIVEDAAHALGTVWTTGSGATLLPVGANAKSDLTTFSFHPVKTIAMGEGGAVTANDPELAHRLRLARSHGIAREKDRLVLPEAFDASGAVDPWYYEVAAPGFNFRVPDINCALGLSQLAKLQRFVHTRRRLVRCYDSLLAPLHPLVRPLERDARSLTAWHIYPVRIDFTALELERGAVMRALAAEGIGTQVHYIPLHRQPYYAARYGAQILPGAESYYRETLSLPLHAGMDEADATRVASALRRHLGL